MNADAAQNDSQIVIVGGGLAGVRTAKSLRDLGHAGGLRVLSSESEPPYDRPPLSKGFLLGDLTEESIQLMEPAELDERGIELNLDAKVVGADLGTKSLALEDGTEVNYGRLVIATGADSRPLELLPPSRRVHYLRSAADARRLRTALTATSRVAVVGAGFIGLEVAASARSIGCAVQVVELASLPLAGVIGDQPARWLQSWHAARGIEFHCGVTVEHARDSDTAQLLELSDGSRLEVDVVVVGVGVTRATEWLADAGLPVHHGLVCDDAGRTTNRDVFGVGDVVCRHDPHGGCRPVEHWTAASDSAARTAAAILGTDPPTAQEDGFFWSDQADLKLQFAGRVTPEAATTVVKGNFDENAFVAHYTVGERLAAAFAANSPRDFLRSRVALRSAGQTPQGRST
jgi:3-phenylpropionate/trans-cinnamate dioxygenase ferredoxin reductase subunit